MESDDLRRLLKRIAVAGSFFLLALLMYLLGRTNYSLARGLLVAYALIVTVLTVLAILLQSGRGGGLASIGGMGGDTLLGARSATPIAKATYVMGALFLFICMLIARLGIRAPVDTAGAIGSGQEAPLEERLGLGGDGGEERPAEETNSTPQPPAPEQGQ